MQQIKHIKLAIKPHDFTDNQVCAICGNTTEPQKPFDLFLDNTTQIVCKRCAEKYAPDLVSLMDYFYKGHYVEPEYEEIENEMNAIKALAAELSADDIDQLQDDLRRISKMAYVLLKYIADHVEEYEEPV